MRKPAAENETFTRLLSEEEKAARGLDTASFLKRMQNRLDKVRGKTENNEESFFLRHNYQTSLHGLA